MRLAATAAPERTGARPAFPAGAPLILGLLALALMLPVLLGPVRLNDSHWINYSWSRQFTDEVLRGRLWPRWLPASHGGLGSPTFFFYGPAAFWLAALFGAIGAATWPALVLAAMAGLWGSGLAMFAYLRARGERPIVGAIAYMAAPYHLLDFGTRGALAEFCGYASLPLVALGIRRCGIGRPALFAAAYALLILTHLPTALLASLFLVPALVLFEHGRDRRAWACCVGGLTLGLALAAPYLLPALSLQRYASIGTMTGTVALDASRWTIWSDDPRLAGGLWLIGAVAAGSAILAMGCLRDRWSAFVLAAVAMTLGVVPALWRLPLLAPVQFPWRMLVLVEFGAALLVARATIEPARLLLLASLALVVSLLVTVNRPADSLAVPSLANLDRLHPDVIEYLPPGMGERQGAWSRAALALSARTPPVETKASWTTLRHFAFPSWRVRCGGVVAPQRAEPHTGLLQYQGHDCEVSRGLTKPELLGWLLALVGMAALALTIRVGGSPYRGGRSRRDTTVHYASAVERCALEQI